MSKEINPLAIFSTRKGKDFFGWPAWHTLHCFAVRYHPSKRSAAIKLVEAYMELLPCDTCQVNFRKKLEQYPINDYLGSNHDFFFWTYLCHDIVNQYKNVKSPPYDKVKSIYFNALGESCSDCQVSV